MLDYLYLIRPLFLSLFLVGFVCGTADWQTTEVSRTDSQHDLEAIRRVTSGIIVADNAGDAAAVMLFYADDAVLLPPNDSPVVGKEAIRGRYEEGFRHFRFDISASSSETTVFGDWAFDRGTTSGKTVPRTDEPVRRVHDKYIMILQRQANGSWKIARLMWNSSEPSTTSRM